MAAKVAAALPRHGAGFGACSVEQPRRYARARPARHARAVEKHWGYARAQHAGQAMTSIVYVNGSSSDFFDFFEEVYVYMIVCVYYVGYNDVSTFGLHI